MTLRFFTGFDWVNDAGSEVNAHDLISFSETTDIDGGRFGGGSVILSSNSAYIGHTFDYIPATYSPFFSHVYYKISANPSSNSRVIRLMSATNVEGAVWINTDGKIALYRGNSTTLLATSTSSVPLGSYFNMGIKHIPDNTTGEFEVTINGVSFVSFSGDTRDTADTNGIENMYIYGATGATVNVDDWMIFDDTGSIINDLFLRDFFVDLIRPTADTATADFTPLSAGDNYAEVEDISGFDGDTSYNSSSTINHKDIFDHNGSSLVDKDILGVKVNAAFKNDGGSSPALKTILKSGGTEYYSAIKVQPSGVYDGVYAVYSLDPKTAAEWTIANLDATEFGYQHTDADGVRVSLSDLEVCYFDAWVFDDLNLIWDVAEGSTAGGNRRQFIIVG